MNCRSTSGQSATVVRVCAITCREAITVLDTQSMEPVPGRWRSHGRDHAFRGNLVMKGYLKNEKATEEAFAGGWFHTGDLAVMHPDGYVKIRTVRRT